MFADGGSPGFNEYLMFRVLTESKKKERRISASVMSSVTPPSRSHRGSLAILPNTFGSSILSPNASGYAEVKTEPCIETSLKEMIQQKLVIEPFCSPVVPHVPIRQRLSYRRCTSVETHDLDGSVINFPPRRRKMSLLQSLRQQNKTFNDSGFDLHKVRTDSENASSPPQRSSSPNSPIKTRFGSFKARTRAMFGGKHSRLEVRRTLSTFGECSHSSDPIANGRSRKSPSTTNDSGRGSQGHLDEKPEMILDKFSNKSSANRHKVVRTNSSPSVLVTPQRCVPIVDEETEEDIVFADINNSPVNDRDFRIELLLRKKAEEMEKKMRLSSIASSESGSNVSSTVQPNGSAPPLAARSTVPLPSPARSNSHTPLTKTPALAFCFPRVHAPTFGSFRQGTSPSSAPPTNLPAESHQPKQLQADDVASTASAALTENLADFDECGSNLMLDYYLPLLKNHPSPSTSSESSLDLAATSELYVNRRNSYTTASITSTSAQTDLSLINSSSQLSEYFEKLRIEDDKEPASQAGSDPSVGWAPKNMNKAGKHMAAPAARANKIHRDPRPNGSKYGRPGRHQHRDWGNRHGELKEEKIAPHKDAWTKFLSNEDPGQRTIFECDFEDRVLASDDDSHSDRVPSKHNSSFDHLQLQMAYNASRSNFPSEGECELLTILTYAPFVQFITATVKKARSLPFNNAPFARIILFEGRRLVEQKQTTVNPSVCRPIHATASSTSDPYSALKPSSSSSSSTSSHAADVAFFSESFLFHVAPEKLDKCHLVIEMFDHNSSNRAVSIGHCVLGTLATGTGHAHWAQMVKKPKLPVSMWHRMLHS